MKSLAWVGAAGVVAMVGAGCEVGTDSGNPFDGDGNTGGTPTTGEGGGCEEIDSTDLDLDAGTALGVTAQEVLALALGEATYALHWGEDGASWGALAGTDTELTVRVEADTEGGARWVDLEPKASEDGTEEGPLLIAVGEIGSECADVLQIDVRVSVTTADGALDESFDAVLSATRAQSASWYAQLDIDDVMGGFAYATDRFTATGIALQMTHTTLGGSGAFFVESESNDGAAASQGVLAMWPSDNTCVDGVPVDTDAAVGATSLEAVFAEIEDGLPTVIEWGDAESAALTWDASLREGTACALLPDGFEPLTLLQADVDVHLRSDDERLDASVPFRLEAYVDETGALSRASLNHGSLYGRLEPSELVDTYGLVEVDVSDFEEASVSIQWNDGRPTGGSATGTLSVAGLRIPDCVANPAPPIVIEDGTGGSAGGGSAGCQGIDSTVVLEAQLTE